MSNQRTRHEAALQAGCLRDIVVAAASGLIASIIVLLGARFAILPEALTEARTEAFVRAYSEFARAAVETTREPPQAKAIVASKLGLAVYADRRTIQAIAATEYRADFTAIVQEVRRQLGAEVIEDELIADFLFPPSQ